MAALPDEQEWLRYPPPPMFLQRVGKELKTKEMTCGCMQESVQRVRKLLNCRDLVLPYWARSVGRVGDQRARALSCFFVSIDSRRLSVCRPFLALKNKNAAEILPQLQNEHLPKIDYTRGLASRQENSTSWKWDSLPTKREGETRPLRQTAVMEC